MDLFQYFSNRKFFLFYLYSASGRANPVIELEKIGTKRKSPGEKKPAKKSKVDTKSERKSAIVPGAIKKPPPKKGRGRTKSVTPPTITKTRSQRKAQQAALESEVHVKEETEDEDVVLEGETVEIPDEDYVTVLELIDMQNEVLQEMAAIPTDLRTKYYFEQSFAAKLQIYKNVTAQGLVTMYTNMVDYKVGDEMKVAKVKHVSDENYDEGTVIMMKKVNGDKKENDEDGKANKKDGEEKKKDEKENKIEEKKDENGNKKKIETGENTTNLEPDSTNDVQVTAEGEGKKDNIEMKEDEAGLKEVVGEEKIDEKSSGDKPVEEENKVDETKKTEGNDEQKEENEKRDVTTDGKTESDVHGGDENDKKVEDKQDKEDKKDDETEEEKSKENNEDGCKEHFERKKDGDEDGDAGGTGGGKSEKSEESTGNDEQKTNDGEDGQTEPSESGNKEGKGENKTGEETGVDEDGRTEDSENDNNESTGENEIGEETGVDEESGQTSSGSSAAESEFEDGNIFNGR